MNEFGIPSHEKLRRELAKWFAEQGKIAAQEAEFLLSPTTKSEPEIDWDRYELGQLEFSKRMTPLITATWDNAGSANTESLNKVRAAGGLDPNRWRVEDPKLRSQIQASVQELSKSTFATTTKSIDEAKQAVRDAIAGGMDSGKGVPEIKKKLRETFTKASKARANAIALTETSRAYHAAGMASDRESGVVVGYEWEVSSDACPICLDLAAQTPRVRIGEPFATIGTHETYSIIKHPPAHTNCGCSVSPILHPRFGGPDLGWNLQDFEADNRYAELVDFDRLRALASATARSIATAGAVPFGRIGSEAVAARKRIEGAELTQITANGGTIQIPDGPIEDRIKKYTLGDEKVNAIIEIIGGAEAEADRIKIRTDDLRAELKALWDLDFGQIPQDLVKKRIKAIHEERDKIDLETTKNDTRIRDHLVQLLSVKKPQKIDVVGFMGTHKGVKFDGFLNSKDDEKIAKNAIGDVAKITASGKSRLTTYVGLKEKMRPYYSLPGDHIGANPGDPPFIYHHEIGHFLDEKLVVGGGKKLNERSQEFLKYRVGNEPPTSIKDVLKDNFYDASEKGRKDNFDRAFGEQGWYVGKDYGKFATEITSKGLEKLFADPVGFAKNDPEYCKYILGILDGSLR